MATITSLPDELIPIILSYKDITIEDIINFRCVCKQFRYAASYPKYMEKKFSQRWPSLKKYCNILSKNHEKNSILTFDLHLACTNTSLKDYTKYESKKQLINFIELGIIYTRQLRDYMSVMICVHCKKPIIDNSMNFECIFYLSNHFDERYYEMQIYGDQRFSLFSYFNDEFKNLLVHSSRRAGCDLTERYYYEKLFQSMRICDLKFKLNKFDILPDALRIMERPLVIVAQTIQIQRDVCSKYIMKALDNIALEVQNYLKEKHPHHSIFSSSVETSSYWKINNINDNHWNQAEGIQLMDALDECMFDKLNFRPCKINDTNVEYMCIDNVLKSKYGQEIILIIIYHSVGRRLGLHIKVLPDPSIQFGDRPEGSHCIYWQSSYDTNNPENKRCFSLTFDKFPDCLVKLNLLDNISSIPQVPQINMRDEIMLRIANLTYYYNNTSQITQRHRIHAFRPGDNKIKKFRLKRPKWFINPQQFIRTEDVKFVVGMMVRHRDKCNNCDGVIIGWNRPIDKRFDILTRNQHDDDTSKIDVLPLKHCRNYKFRKQQTNYIILTDNDQICYVNEDNLTLAAPKWINNYEIGRYFCKFENTHYVPNKMLRELYPQDADIITQKTKSSN